MSDISPEGLAAIITALVGGLVALGGGLKWLFSRLEQRNAEVKRLAEGQEQMAGGLERMAEAVEASTTFGSEMYRYLEGDARDHHREHRAIEDRIMRFEDKVDDRLDAMQREIRERPAARRRRSEDTDDVAPS